MPTTTTEPYDSDNHITAVAVGGGFGGLVIVVVITVVVILLCKRGKKSGEMKSVNNRLHAEGGDCRAESKESGGETRM